MRRRNFTGIILDPKGGDAGSVSPGVEKSLRAVQRERDDLTTTTRLAIDPTTARKSRKGLGNNWPSRPPIAARQTRQQRRQFCSVYITGVTILRDEVPRSLPANQRSGSSPGWESPADLNREASLIPNHIRILLRRRNATGIPVLETSRTFGCEYYLSPNNTRGESLIHYVILHTRTISTSIWNKSAPYREIREVPSKLCSCSTHTIYKHPRSRPFERLGVKIISHPTIRIGNHSFIMPYYILIRIHVNLN